MTSRREFLDALSTAPVRPVSGESSVPGLPAGEFSIPALWSITDRMERRAGPAVMEQIRASTARFLAGDEDDDDLPWKD